MTKIKENQDTLKSKRALLDLPSVTSAKLLESHNSSVTTAWGVNWGEDYIARDILLFRFATTCRDDADGAINNTSNTIEE